MRAHAPTLALFSILSFVIVAATRAAPVQPLSDSGAITGVATIVDGDSLKIEGTSIRLHGIDAPEMAQACNSAVATGPRQIPVLAAEGAATWRCGLEAKRALAHMIDGHPVACTPTTLDKYGRTVARCRASGIDLNAEMVRSGMAWAFVRYSSDYVGQEREARAARRGIWQAETQTAWDFRAAKWQAAVAAAPDVGAPEGCAIKGNVTGDGARIYHLPWSPWYANVRMDAGSLSRKGKRWFCSEAEAVAAGWRPSATR